MGDKFMQLPSPLSHLLIARCPKLLPSLEHVFPSLPKASVWDYTEKNSINLLLGPLFFFYPHIEMLGFHLTTFFNFPKL